MGFIIPINSITYFYKNVNKINDIICKNTSNKIYQNSIKMYLIKLNKEKKILGDLEIPLNICIDILKFNFYKKSKDEQFILFMSIKKLINKYEIFLKKFTNNNYNDINLILQFIPELIQALINIKFNWFKNWIYYNIIKFKVF